jgi:hypothetical protein
MMGDYYNPDIVRKIPDGEKIKYIDICEAVCYRIDYHWEIKQYCYVGVRFTSILIKYIFNKCSGRSEGVCFA